MIRILFCRVYKRRCIRVILIVFIAIALFNCIYFESKRSSFTDPMHKLILSNDTDKKSNDEMGALIQLWKIKGTRINLRSDERIGDWNHLVENEVEAKTSGKPQENIKKKVKLVENSRYQATQGKAQNVKGELDGHVRLSNLRDAGNDYKSTPINQIFEASSLCPNNTLGYMSSSTAYGKCKPHRPSEEACKDVQRMYYLRPSKCEEPHQKDICKLSVSFRNNQKILKARCNRKLCRQEKDSLVVKTLNPKTGQHDVIRTFSSIPKLEKGLPLIMEHSRRHEFNYAFLECNGMSAGRKVVQLLPTDPCLTIKDDGVKPRNKHQLNVNIILIDSVARAHFYRSLPKTISAFKRWINDSTHSPARVFDFELFQAIEGHTADNTHALFTGQLFPKSIDRSSPPAVGMEYLFGHYKRAGYQTSWQEDLCWEGQWGLFVDLDLPLYWRLLAPRLKQVHIDTTGNIHLFIRLRYHLAAILDLRCIKMRLDVNDMLLTRFFRLGPNH